MSEAQLGPAQHDSYDSIVIGGGPAGSTAATLIAKEGHRVLILDRETFPRFRIGESLMPATYWTLKRLNVLEKMHASNFTEKHSVQFFSGSGRASAPFYFHEFDEHESSQTWQVVRSEFDKMLIENSAEHGAEVCQGANVKEVLFDGTRATGVVVEFSNGERREITAKAVVDASGQTSMISRKLKLKKVDPKLKHAAYFTRYTGARREPGIDEGATLVLQTKGGVSWFWYIPLPNDEVSVGVVGPVEHLKSLGSSPREVFEAEKKNCPALLERIEYATEIVDITAMRDFSYLSKQIAGDGWILAGDAFGFLDPVYSTGVFLAMKSGEFAADAVLEGLRDDDLSAAKLGQYGKQYVEGMEAMRKLVYAYYDQEFSIPMFLKKHPECREHIVNLLVGNVFRVSIGNLFELMGQFTDLPESRALEDLERAV